jgi:hypothetical protein
MASGRCLDPLVQGFVDLPSAAERSASRSLRRSVPSCAWVGFVQNVHSSGGTFLLDRGRAITSPAFARVAQLVEHRLPNLPNVMRPEQTERSPQTRRGLTAVSDAA